jgi:hypothetical protein
LQAVFAAAFKLATAAHAHSPLKKHGLSRNRLPRAGDTATAELQKH